MVEPARKTGPLIILRIEAAVAFGLLCWGYGALGYSWWLFALLLLAPDVSMIGYLVNERIGAAAYNLFHNSAAPMVLGALGYGTGADLALALALIWGAHIALDRTLGYGLKYAKGFGYTHLGRIGRAAETG